MSPPLRILLVDDHDATRASLRTAIEAAPGLVLAGEAADYAGAIRLALEIRPEVMVLDLNLPDGNGWQLLEELRVANALPATLVLSVCDESIFARRLFRSGARGYLMKDEPLARIVRGIREVAAGHLVASPNLTTQLMREALGEEDHGEAEVPLDCRELSDRELQIFSLLGSGLRGKEVAQQLKVSEKTVATYKIRLMRKLGASSTPELIARYRRMGLEAPSP